MKNIIVSISMAAFITTLAGPADIIIVRDGTPLATVVVGTNASAQVNAAAQTLVYYVEKATGAKLPVAAAAPKNGVAVRIGTLDASAPSMPKDLDGDGFVVQAKDGGIAIMGPTDWGTEFGVYEFLERFVGVRWLLPGPDGTDVPAARTIAVPEGTVTGAPKFFSRQASGLRGDPQTAWARFNRMHGRVSFHHNLRWLFPPETYAKTHPEFYPVKKGGARYVPRDNNDHHWQPCLTAPGIVDEAVKNINAYFAKNPGETSYSLGMNDNSSFCECAACRAKISGEKNSFGFVDYADLYYEWCAAVIDGVLKTYPDKWFGCLAYCNVISPPKRTKVHPRLVPYVTYDRMKWLDPAIAKDGKAVTEAWARSAAALGWYDYAYGSPYCVPRVYFHQMQDYLSYGKAAGVKAQYAELYPNWGEGPKPYVMMKLWWDPALDVDKLLKEWYVRCVGEAAAPHLEKYYAIWEKFWTGDALRTQWFAANGNAQYLAFSDPGYLEAVRPEAVAESRRLLDACAAACATKEQRARASIIERAFRYYEACALLYADAALVKKSRIASDADAAALLRRIEESGTRAAKANDLAASFAKDPVLQQPIANSSVLTISLLNQQVAWAHNFFEYASLSAADASRQGIRERIETFMKRQNIPMTDTMKKLIVFATKMVVVKKLTAPPAVGADPDEAVWKDVESEGGFICKWEDARFPTVFKAARCGTSLFLRIQCFQPMGEKLSIVGRGERDGAVWNDNSVELFLNPDAPTNGNDFLQVIVNPEGAVFDQYEQKPDFNVAYRLTVRRCTDHWLLDIELPLRTERYDYTKYPVLRMNIVRNVFGGPTYQRLEMSGWFPTLLANRDLFSRGVLIMNR